MKRLAMLLLAGCGADMPPPPYDVYFCAGTPEEDIALWQDAMDQWETQVDRGELFVEQPGERPAGECALTICAGGELAGRLAFYHPDPCRPYIRYERENLFFTRQHELGHALGLSHASYGTMRPKDNSINYVTPADAERVRRRWGL